MFTWSTVDSAEYRQAFKRMANSDADGQVLFEVKADTSKLERDLDSCLSRAELKARGAKVRIQVSADTSAATPQLDAVAAKANALDTGRKVTVTADDKASGALDTVSIALTSFPFRS